MKIVSWNCEGPLYCGKDYETEKWEKSKVPYIKHFCPDADIYAIQECSKIWSNKWECKYKDWHGDTINLGERGIALFSNRFSFMRLNTNGEDVYRYFIPYIVNDTITGFKFLLIHIWTKDLDSNGRKYHSYIGQVKDALNNFEYMKSIKDKRLPILCVGDFNFGWKYPRNQRNAESFYDEVKSKLNLYPFVTLKDSPYTFKREYFNDCCFSTPEWTLKECCKYGDYAESDHCPVLFDLELKE